MKTLVLLVDRDDDLGVKAGIKGPIIGRERNFTAASKLGLADPEDSDVNVMLTGLSILDELRKGGHEAEIATITGDVRVGPMSDTILTSQLEEVLAEVKPSRAFLVSDGAEDEYIFPMIASRIRVDHVRRVYVKQVPAFESTVYAISKGLKDKKIRRRFLVPLGLVLVAFGIVALINPLLAPAIITLVIGLYILGVSLPVSGSPRELYRRADELYDRMKTSVVSGDMTIPFSLIAVIFFLLGIFFGFDQTKNGSTYTQQFLLFVAAALWWFILGFLTIEAGRVGTAYFKKGKVPAHVLVVAGTIIAIGLLILGTVESLSILLQFKSLRDTLPLVYVAIATSVIIIVAGGYSYKPKEEKSVEDSWRH